MCAHVPALVPTVATVPVACCPDANGSGPHGEHAIPCFSSIGKREKELTPISAAVGANSRRSAGLLGASECPGSMNLVGNAGHWLLPEWGGARQRTRN